MSDIVKSYLIRALKNVISAEEAFKTANKKYQLAELELGKAKADWDEAQNVELKKTMKKEVEVNVELKTGIYKLTQHGQGVYISKIDVSYRE